MSADELFYLSIAEAAARIKAGALSPVELTQAYLARIERLDSQLNAYITLFWDEALAAARQAEEEVVAGHYRGPLHGIPLALKDLVYTRHVRTTGGSRVLSSFLPEEDATIVGKLREAGAVLLGKTGMHEFAYGPTGLNPHFGNVRNPWDAARMTGGSSSGSGAAVAAGLCAGAIGSDTGGSIRIPASLCGIVGLKPTYGRVSRYGVLPLSWSLDHVGPMTRTVEDAALFLNALAGHDPKDPASAREPAPNATAALGTGVQGLRLGLARDYFFSRVNPEVLAAVERAVALLEEQGASVHDVALPLVHQASFINSPIIQGEAATYHLPLLRSRWQDYSPEVRLRLLPGLAVTGSMYLNGQRARALMTQQALALFDQVDLLISPATSIPAPLIEEESITLDGRTETVSNALTRLARPFNMTGFPAISLPCGFTTGGLPVGLQIAGRPWDEATVLRAAYAYEQASPWRQRRPPL
ncbi:MAG: amidase [Chloroflexi bacterium]|nr:amidase [Chloroflexota bacterium]